MNRMRIFPDFSQNDVKLGYKNKIHVCINLDEFLKFPPRGAHFAFTEGRIPPCAQFPAIVHHYFLFQMVKIWQFLQKIGNFFLYTLEVIVTFVTFCIIFLFLVSIHHKWRNTPRTMEMHGGCFETLLAEFWSFWGQLLKLGLVAIFPFPGNIVKTKNVLEFGLDFSRIWTCPQLFGRRIKNSFLFFKKWESMD